MKKCTEGEDHVRYVCREGKTWYKQKETGKTGQGKSKFDALKNKRIREGEKYVFYLTQYKKAH